MRGSSLNRTSGRSSPPSREAGSREPAFQCSWQHPVQPVRHGCGCRPGQPHGWDHGMLPAGIIHRKRYGGLTLNWARRGQARPSRQDGRREGFETSWREGCARAADILGRAAIYALHIKGLDLSISAAAPWGWSLGATILDTGWRATHGWRDHRDHGRTGCEKRPRRLRYATIQQTQEYETRPAGLFQRGSSGLNNCMGICHYNTSYFDPNLRASPRWPSFTPRQRDRAERGDLKRIAMRQLNLERP